MVSAARLAAGTLRVLPRKRISRFMGRLADLEASPALLERVIDAFVRAYGVDLDEAILPPAGFSSFDAFFTRKLKPGMRPLDPRAEAILSPADGRVEDLGPIDDRSVLVVKGCHYTVAELLADPQAAQRYAGGVYAVVYLSPRDYHRVHAPVTVRVVQLRHVPGTLYPVNKIGLDHVPRLFARNERVVIEQESERFGRVSSVMVGAIGVGRITVAFDDLITNRGAAAGVREYGAIGPTIARGEEIGTFHLGSTVVLMVPRDARASLTVPPGSTIRLGTALALGRNA
jgi:phosphatidylserine decarboxylase